MIKPASPMAPEGGAPPPTMPTSSVLDTKTTPDLLPTNLVMGSLNEIYSATKQDTNSTATTKAKQDHEIAAKELSEETTCALEGRHASNKKEMEASKLSRVSEIREQVVNTTFITKPEPGANPMITLSPPLKYPTTDPKVSPYGISPAPTPTLTTATIMSLEPVATISLWAIQHTSNNSTNPVKQTESEHNTDTVDNHNRMHQTLTHANDNATLEIPIHPAKGNK